MPPPYNQSRLELAQEYSATGPCSADGCRHIVAESQQVIGVDPCPPRKARRHQGPVHELQR
jgi:hypothetical protein